MPPRPRTSAVLATLFLAGCTVLAGCAGPAKPARAGKHAKQLTPKRAKPAAPAAPPAAPPEEVGLSSWERTADGVTFRLADGRSATLTVRSPLAVRLSWSPSRGGKNEDWLLDPPADGADRSFAVAEADGRVTLSTPALRVSTPRSALRLTVSDAAGRRLDGLPLVDGAPSRVLYEADHTVIYEDAHDYVWAYAPSATRLEVLARYAETTGFAPMPPKWVTGIAHGVYADEPGLLAVAAGWRDRRLPVDALWGDGGVFSEQTVNDLTSGWHAATFEKLRAAHFAVGRWMMHSTRPGATTWDELSGHHWLATAADGTAVTDFWGDPVGGSCPDPFDPAARAAYKLDHAKNQGVGTDFDFLKVDFRDVRPHEFYCLGNTVKVPKGFGVPFDARGGTNAAWRLLLSRATFEATRDLDGPGQRGWVVTKYPVPGYQRYYCVWPDDHAGSFDDLRASAQTMLDYARQGLPWYCDDLGGFKNRQAPPRELFLRWFEYGVFTPWPTLFGKRSAGLRVPWEYDAEAVETFRKYDELRYRLIPYLYTYAHQAHTTGRPIVLPLDVAFPGDPGLRPAAGAAPPPNYLYGNEFLVAPVTAAAPASWDVYLPAGADWVEHATGRRFPGGTTASVAAPVDRLPLFVRAGAIVPMARPGKQYVADGGLVDREITWDVYPPAAGCTGSFTLYEDDGLTRACDAGQFGLTRIEAAAGAGGRLVVRQEPTRGAFDGRPDRRTYLYKLNGRDRAPARVLRRGVPLAAVRVPDLAAAPAAYAWDPAARTVTVRLADVPTAEPVELTVEE
ncbi:MAG TPA: TIM-barrel domain-containing protein [Humisphaera sp.]